MENLKYILASLIALLLLGCHSAPTPNPNDSSRTVPALAQTAVDAIARADGNVTKIETAVAAATPATLEATKAEVKTLAPVVHSDLKDATGAAGAAKERGEADAKKKAEDDAKYAADLAKAKEKDSQGNALRWAGVICALLAGWCFWKGQIAEAVGLLLMGAALFVFVAIIHTLETLTPWLVGAGVIAGLVWAVLKYRTALQSIVKGTTTAVNSGALVLTDEAKAIFDSHQTPLAKAAVNAAQGRVT